MTRSPCIACAGLVLLVACASETLRPDYEGARTLIAATTGVEAVYDPEAPPLTHDELQAALADGLGREEAVRLALLNSRRLQAGFMGLGIARADYVQSGLLENPTLGLSFLFPAGSARTRLGGNLYMAVAETWRLPERRRVAEAAMDQRLLDLGRLSGELVADTSSAYHRAVAARALAGAAAGAADLASRAQRAVEDQATRGLVTELAAQATRADALGAELAARRAMRAEAETLRTLAGLLSLTDDLQSVTLSDELPEARLVPADTESLVSHAVSRRLDLRAMEAAVASAEARVALERERAGPEVQAGVGFERPESDSPTDHVLGPTLSVELPIFDGNQAQISRAEFELEQLRRAREALDAELRQQVRAAADGARLAGKTARFLLDELLPQAERTAALAKTAYERGNITLLPLLEAERNLARARTTGIESQLEAALATVELERALGSPLPAEGMAP